MGERKDTGTSLAVGWFLLLIVIFAAGMFIWWLNKYEIMDSIRWIRWGQLQVLKVFMDHDHVVMLDPAGNPVTLAQFDTMLANTPKRALTPDVIGLVSNVVMRPMLPFFSMAMILMALWVMFYGPGTQYRRRYDLNGLIRAQSRAFPIISPLVAFDPGKQPVRPPGAPVPADLPPFAEALSPEEWIAYNEIPTLTDRAIDQVAAARAFARQLGAPWRGWMYLSPYRQVLLAAFALKSVRKRKESDEILGRLALCWSKGVLRLDRALLREARSILRNSDVSGKILSKCNQHAFETTALLRALATARDEGGVLAPAQFIWLRAYDRSLWYPMNNLGRNAFHMEALGAMGHYKAEKMSQRPIVRPKVDGAVESLTAYMKSLRSRPIPQLDYSRSKRRGIKKIKGKAA